MFKNLKDKLKNWAIKNSKIRKYKNKKFNNIRQLDSLYYFKLKYVFFNTVIIEHRYLLDNEDYLLQQEELSYSKFLELVEKYL